jgi:hypothetical protein
MIKVVLLSLLALGVSAVEQTVAPAMRPQDTDKEKVRTVTDSASVPAEACGADDRVGVYGESSSGGGGGGSGGDKHREAKGDGSGPGAEARDKVGPGGQAPGIVTSLDAAAVVAGKAGVVTAGDAPTTVLDLGEDKEGKEGSEEGEEGDDHDHDEGDLHKVPKWDAYKTKILSEVKLHALVYIMCTDTNTHLHTGQGQEDQQRHKQEPCGTVATFPNFLFS